MRFLRKAFDVQVGEARRALLMWSYLFLVVAALLVVKPAATSLFVSEFGASGLPFAYLLVALAAGGASMLYARLLARVRIDRLISRSLQGGIAVLVGLWTVHFFYALSGWLLYAFYVFVAIWAVTSASQFWILANLVFNAREAKRLFSLVGTGGIAGGVVGGYSTNLLAPLAGTEAMLLISAGLLACCVPVIRLVWRETARPAGNAAYQQRRVSPRRYRHSLRLFASSRHLRLIALLVGVAVVVAKFVDFQFAVLAGQAFESNDELTAFFAFWLSTFNLVSLGVQLLVTRRMVGLLGVARSLLLLPAAILIGSAVLFIVPGLAAATALRTADGSLKQSLNKAGMELLYLPVPASLKTQAKTFIDIFVDSVATGLGGLILAVATLGFGLGTRGIAVMIFVLASVWIWVARQVREEYLLSLRSQIENLRASAAKGLAAGKTRTVVALRDALQSDDADTVATALELVPEPLLGALAETVAPLCLHGTAGIRAAALRQMNGQPRPDLGGAATRLLTDEDPEVRMEAFAYLYSRHQDAVGFLRRHLAGPGLEQRCAALACAAREARTNRAVRDAVGLEDAIEGLLAEARSMPDGDAQELAKATAATAIGEASATDLYHTLHVLLADSSAHVRRASLAAAARTTDPEFTPAMLRGLADRPTREAAIEALEALGAAGAGALVRALDDPTASRGQRLGVLDVLGAIGSQQVVEVLFAYLGHDDPELRSQAARSLNRLRRDHPGLHFDEQKVERTILEEAKDYLDTLTVLRTRLDTGEDRKQEAKSREHAARMALIELVEQRLDDDLERIFRLLGLRYPQEAIHDAFVGLQPQQPEELRASAVEFLDNLLDPQLKRVIIPLIETTLGESLGDSQVQIPSEQECMRTLLASRDTEVALAALSLVVESGPRPYAADIASLTESNDPAVTAAARVALDRIVQRRGPG